LGRLDESSAFLPLADELHNIIIYRDQRFSVPEQSRDTRGPLDSVKE
jgi:hypothetical protein